MPLTTTEARALAPAIVTLGDLQNLLKAMKANGWTLGSVEYVIDQVFWQEIDVRNAARKGFKEDS